MKTIVKQVLGIDVAQDELVVSLGRMYDDWTPDLYASKNFPNTTKGFNSLVSWTKKLTEDTAPLRYVMEATGVYHESLSYYLDTRGYEVSIILPNKISNYARSLDIKTVTDKTASEAIVRFGLERNLDKWTPPKVSYKKLRLLTRERGQLMAERTMLKNQLHAEQSQADPYKSSIVRIKKRIALLIKQEKEITEETETLIRAEEEIRQKVILLCSIPGIGTLTAATVIGECNGFELIRNKRQLTSYAGLDVMEKQSGTSVKGKPRISKKGNRYLRKAMHFPALTAIQYDERYKRIFDRLVSKHGVKMKAVVAVQRKLLEMMYVVYKTQTPYNKDYLKMLEVV